MSMLLSQAAQAQYKTAVGLRLGYPTSATIKYFANETLAFEAYVGTRGFGTYRWNNVSAALQIHRPVDFIEELEGLNYYFGGGATVFFWSFEGFTGTGFGTTSLGVQGYLGLDYAFEDVPINLSVDWIPTVFVGDSFTTGFGGGYGTIAVRYILGRG